MPGVDDASTFPDLLARRLRADPSQPLLTAYDEESGERTELSGTTYANWVAKTGNLLLEELDLEAGSTVLLDLPPHWLVPVFLGAAWTAGVVVTTDPATPHDAVVCGPGTVAERAAEGGPVVACSLRPFADRFADPLPAGVLDHGTLWAGQPDAFLGLDPVSPDTPAWVRSDGSVARQGDLLDRARDTAYAEGVRLLTDVHPAHDDGVPVLLGPLVHGGSVVLLRHPTTQQWPARREDERATEELRSGEPG